MDIAIDTSTVLGVVCGAAGRDRAIELTTGHTLIAPASLHWEIGNALSAMVKRGRISLAKAKACATAYEQIPIKTVDIDLGQALDLVKQLGIYAYDAYMLVCARQSGSPILTYDHALKLHAASLAIVVLEA